MYFMRYIRMHSANYLMTEERHKWKYTSSDGSVKQRKRQSCDVVRLPQIRGKVPLWSLSAKPSPIFHRQAWQKTAERNPSKQSNVSVKIHRREYTSSICASLLGVTRERCTRLDRNAPPTRELAKKSVKIVTYT